MVLLMKNIKKSKIINKSNRSFLISKTRLIHKKRSMFLMQIIKKFEMFPFGFLFIKLILKIFIYFKPRLKFYLEYH